MKKIISIILATVLLFGMTMTVFGADNQTEINLTLDESMESYELVIPASVPVDLSQDETRFNVRIQNISLVWNERVKIYVSSANPDLESGMGAFLVNTEDTSKKIHYNMYVGGPEYQGKETFMGMATSTSYIGAVDIIVDGEFPGSGTYTDTLTFRITAE